MKTRRSAFVAVARPKSSAWLTGGTVAVLLATSPMAFSLNTWCFANTTAMLPPNFPNSNMPAWQNSTNGLSNVTPHMWPPFMNPPTISPIAVSTARGYSSLVLNADGRVFAAGESDAEFRLGGAGAGPGNWIPNLFGVIGLSGAGPVDAGMNLALIGDGTVRSWGKGALANAVPSGSIVDPSPAGIVLMANGKPLDEIKEVVTSGGSNYALVGNGNVVSWGYGIEHQWPVDKAKYTYPNPSGLIGTFKQISAGMYHFLGLRTDGTVVTIGCNIDRQCTGPLSYFSGVVGYPNFTTPPPPVLPQQITLSLPRVKQVAAGYVTSFALTSTGEVYSWGRNEPMLGQGPFGSGSIGQVYIAQNQPLTQIMSIWAGRDAAYALRADGVLFGMGMAHAYQLGSAPPSQKFAAPVVTPNITGLPGSSGVIGGTGNGPVLLMQATATAQFAGTIGTSNVSSFTSYMPTGLSPFGLRHWSQGNSGGIGIDAHGKVWIGANPTLMTQVNLGSTAGWPHLAIDACTVDNRHLVLLANGVCMFWGTDVEGLVGPQGAVVTIPTLVPHPMGMYVLKARLSHGDTFFLMDNGQVYHKGKNLNDISGTGASGQIATPTWKQVLRGTVPIADAIDLAISNQFGLVLDGAGQVYGWGKGPLGEVGSPNAVKYTAMQIPIFDSSGKFQPIKQIACGTDHSLALGTDGYAYTWGNNKQGQLAWGAYSSGPNPTPKPTLLHPIKELAGGRSTSYFLMAKGQLQGCGANGVGQLGFPTPLVTPSPIPINTSSTWKLAVGPFSPIGAVLKP